LICSRSEQINGEFRFPQPISAADFRSRFPQPISAADFRSRFPQPISAAEFRSPNFDRRISIAD
jgi:hypothetical protein